MKEFAHRYPLVSVLMPSFNQGRFIEESLLSIVQQGYPALEVLVMDAQSTDNTADVVAKLQTQHPEIRFISQPDDGPADALNKGLELSRGVVIGWLNSDDLYNTDCILQAVSRLMEDDQVLMVYGNAQHIDENGEILGDYPTVPPSRVQLNQNTGCFICQPTVFFKHTMSTMLGPFDQELKTAFDFDYWMRAFTHFDHRIDHISQYWAKSRLHKNCITLKQRRQVLFESMKTVAHYTGVCSGKWLGTYWQEVSSTIDNPEERHEDFEEFLGKVSAFTVADELLEYKKQLVKVVS